MNLITMSAVAVTLFLGGTSGPLTGSGNWVDTWILPTTYFLVKLIALLYGTVWLRAALPRLRYDQLMSLAWKYLIELSFLWVAALLVLRVSKSQSWSFVKAHFDLGPIHLTPESITGGVVSLLSVIGGVVIFFVLRKC